jgi:hypothetical protein
MSYKLHGDDPQMSVSKYLPFEYAKCYKDRHFFKFVMRHKADL